MQPRVGDKIRIVHMDDRYISNSYDGKEGYITFIDDEGLLHGTWGGLAVIPDVDEYIIL